jgi:hypothetical protein
MLLSPPYCDEVYRNIAILCNSIFRVSKISNSLGKTGGQKTVQRHAHGIMATVSPVGGTQSTNIGGDLMAHNQAKTGLINSEGTEFFGTGTNNMNPYVTLNYIIKS